MSVTDPIWYRWEGEELLLNLKLQPRASRDGFVGPHGDYFKVCISAPPVDGRANAHLIRFLTGAFGVAKGKIAIENGKNSKIKRIRIKKPKRFPIAADHK